MSIFDASLFPIIGLVLLAVGAIAIAGYVVVADRQRRTVVNRALGDLDPNWRAARAAVLATTPGSITRTRSAWANVVPSSWLDDEAIQEKLTRAGWDTPTAPLTYAASRLICLILFPAVAALIGPQGSYTSLVISVAVGFAAGFILPVGYVDRKIRLRQERIRRSIPDALDLTVVCVEAGISLDAAILRVSKDLRLVHPELAYEFAVVNRKTNAGVSREDALRGLWARTGVEDLRALVSSMIQSEKWGTSISRVLRVAAETLRRKRRQAAEKKAAMAPLKMTIPLVVLILPAMFIVILGPVALQMIATFR